MKSNLINQLNDYSKAALLEFEKNNIDEANLILEQVNSLLIELNQLENKNELIHQNKQQFLSFAKTFRVLNGVTQASLDSIKSSICKLYGSDDTYSESDTE